MSVTHRKTANFTFITHNPLPTPHVSQVAEVLLSHSVLMHSLCFSVTLPKSEPNLLTEEMDPCWLPSWAFSGCSSAGQLLNRDSSRIIEYFKLAKTLKTIKSQQVLFLTGSKACIHKLCCVLVHQCSAPSPTPRKAGGAVWSSKEDDKHLWCTKAKSCCSP